MSAHQSGPGGSTGEDHDRAIRLLKGHIGEMADLALGVVTDGTRALLTGDAALAHSVLTRDAPLDRYDLNIEAETMRTIALQQPEGPDLRAFGAMLKIANCVDRIGRLGYDIANYPTTPPVADQRSIEAGLAAMGEKAQHMVRQALHAFSVGDADEAKAVFVLDDDVDALYRQVSKEILAKLKAGGEGTDRLAYLLLTDRHLERVADNACKIAEKAVYAITGERRTEYFPQMAHRSTTGRYPPGPFLSG
jgi:phosphate transport system protein